VPAKTTKTVLYNFRVQADTDGITLFATDLEMAAKVTLDSVKVGKKGSVLLPARESAALLRELSDPTVTLESNDNRCKIESGGGSFVLLGEDPEQFPEEVAVKSGKRIELSCGQMLRMIQETVFAAAKEETRYAINGVLLDAGSGCVRMVATDGRRLAISYEHTDTKVEFKVVVPLRALNTLSRALVEGSKETLHVEVGDKQIVFTTGKTQLVSQLLETRFPDYEGVLPKSADTTVEVQRSVLESALRRAAILCSADLRMVRFEVGDAVAAHDRRELCPRPRRRRGRLPWSRVRAAASTSTRTSSSTRCASASSTRCASTCRTIRCRRSSRSASRSPTWSCRSASA
jgi:DNA polymerase-3 subunit beta